MFYWDAFMELDSERPPSMSGIAAIPISAILTYADYLGLDAQETRYLMKVVRAVDLHRCRVLSEKQASKQAATKGR